MLFPLIASLTHYSLFAFPCFSFYNQTHNSPAEISFPQSLFTHIMLRHQLSDLYLYLVPKPAKTKAFTKFYKSCDQTHLVIHITRKRRETTNCSFSPFFRSPISYSKTNIKAFQWTLSIPLDHGS